MVGVGQFDVGSHFEAFVFGSSELVEEVTRSLATLNFIKPIESSRIFEDDRESLFFVVALCDFEDRRMVRVVARSLARITNPNAHKVLLAINPIDLRFEHFLFAQEASCHYTAYGIERDQNLRDYLKQVVIARRKEVRLDGVEEELQKASREGKPKAIKRISQRLSMLGKNHPDVLRHLVIALQLMHDYKRAAFYLRQLLELNPQDLWTCSEIMKVYMRLNPAEGYRILDENSDYSYIGPMEEDELNPLTLLVRPDYSETTLSFLTNRAGLAEHRKELDETIFLYRLALMHCNQETLRETLLLKFGSHLLKEASLESVEEAVKVFEEAVSFKGNNFGRAQLQLKQALGLQAKLRAAKPKVEEPPPEPELEEAENEPSIIVGDDEGDEIEIE